MTGMDVNPYQSPQAELRAAPAGVPLWRNVVGLLVLSFGVAYLVGIPVIIVLGVRHNEIAGAVLATFAYAVVGSLLTWGGFRIRRCKVPTEA